MIRLEISKQVMSESFSFDWRRSLETDKKLYVSVVHPLIG